MLSRLPRPVDFRHPQCLLKCSNKLPLSALRAFVLACEFALDIADMTRLRGFSCQALMLLRVLGDFATPRSGRVSGNALGFQKSGTVAAVQA